MRRILLVILLLMCLVSAFEAGRQAACKVDTYTDTLRVVVIDTIKERMPMAVDSVVVRYVTKAISVRDTMWEVQVRDSVVLVRLPIEQRHYAGADYEAWVSGYEARLDSISVMSRTESTVIRTPPRRWHIGPQAGIGWGVAGMEPYIGVGITYSIYSF